MSSLDCLKISGIRSFGPDKPQALKFQSPLTLIVGQNGSGKTTIIECLRYISTGDLPTTTASFSKNTNFAHDLNINDINIAKSQVKLQFVDVNNEKVIASRSMETTRKAIPRGQTKIETKTLDGSIIRLDKRTMEKLTLELKCLDMNREMPKLLGAPDALLNYVIFCHQEDSTWPLSEPKILKTRFDEIFNATKYTKALDAMKATQKELKANIDLYRSELKYLVQFQNQAKNLRQQLRTDEATLEQHINDIDRLKTEIAPVKQRLDEIDRNRAEIDRLREAIAGHTSQKLEIEKNIKDLRARVKDFYLGNIEDLRREIDRFEINQKRILSDLNERKRDLENLNRDETNFNKQRSEMLTSKGKLEAEIQVNENQVDIRDKQIVAYATKSNIAGFCSGPFSDSKVDEFLDIMQNEKRRLDDEMTNIKATLDGRIRQAKDEGEKALNAVASNEQTIKLTENSFEEIEKEIAKTKAFLSDADGRQARLNELDNQIICLETELNKSLKGSDETSLKEEIGKLQSERTEITSKLRLLREELKAANEEASNRKELDLFQKTKSDKESTLEKLLDKHRADLSNLFPGVSTDRLRDTVEDDLTRRSKQLQALMDELNNAKSTQKSKETARDMCQNDLRSKEEELRKAKEKIEKILIGDDIGEELEKIRLDLEKVQLEKGTVDGSESVYKSYIKRLDEKPCCPLCERNFGNVSEASNLSDKLKRDVKLLPDKSTSLRRKIEEKQKRQADLLQLQPIVEMAKNLKNVEIPLLQTRVDELNIEIRKIRKEISDLDLTATMQADEEQTVKTIQGDVGQIDALFKEVRDLNQQIVLLKQSLPLNSDIRSVGAIEDDTSSFQMLLDDINDSLTSKQEQLSKQQETVQRLRQLINNLTKEKLEITDSEQRCITYRQNLTSLTVKRDQLNAELEDSRKQMPFLKRSLDEIRHKERTLEMEKDEHVKDHQKRSQALENSQRSIFEANELIRKFSYSGKRDQFDDVNRKLKAIEDEIAGLMEKRRAMVQKNEEQERACNQSDMRLRDLKDSLQVKENEGRVQELVSKIERIRADCERFGGLDVSGGELKNIVDKHEGLTKRLHEIEGRRMGLEKQINEKQKDLESESLRDADTKHRKMQIQLTTTEVAHGDLDKYHAAIDRAIIQYHSTQLEQINDILRSLWQKIYKHTDIDYIAIRSAPESNTRRRLYDYRVVMQTGGAEIDMRGRCSAGQKILASLLIRIALADVFCNNCGILTLDEPTTNLDSHNIQGLAEALVELVNERSEQKNFQLVLITHDENFVRTLLQGYSMETHYRVKKDANGFSEIVETKNDEFD